MNPYADMPSVEHAACDLGGCREPWAWEHEDVSNGPRGLRLCERHSTAYSMTGSVEALEHRRDEGDDAMAEERVEREAGRAAGWR